MHMKVLAPAKVNLFLRVLGKRPDGYHEIFSLMQPVSLYDEIEISVSDGDGIEVASDSPDAPGGSENLAYRAASLFLERAGLRKRVSIGIKKRIPVGAGLGGGSSDAASVIMALNGLSGAGFPDRELMEMGARLGSDVPFFFLKGPALARGRGEVLERVNLPPLYYVLINPGFHVPTAWVYSSLRLTKKGENNILLYSSEVFADREGLKKALSNDLEAVTIGRYPEISALKEKLTGAGASGALMSGSGPTVFGVFHSREDAERAYRTLESKVAPPARIFLAEGL
ncbi:MAG: 4-(cytidine 5'-diphospho)-2-C-methyl-D-erythritol kinase [Deltaproteobacteria bacterium]|nr:4-(cytidine 5'-diphospho)-2-C-methyl-D-erythritol kinase [Deltaproteobacteria bacterium]MCL4874650.1 4-(cytidine 5'-diphospho)-2-C-methyl-D-erythritol kinase [bacterium]